MNPMNPMNPMDGTPGMMQQPIGMGPQGMAPMGMGPQVMTPGMFGPQLPPSGLVNLDPDFYPGAATLDLGYPCPTAPYMGEMYMHPHHCPPQPVPQPLPQPTPVTYVVKKGDSVYKIAQQFGTTMQAIILANNLRNPDLIYPGQVLLIPGV